MIVNINDSGYGAYDPVEALKTAFDPILREIQAASTSVSIQAKLKNDTLINNLAEKASKASYELSVRLSNIDKTTTVKNLAEQARVAAEKVVGAAVAVGDAEIVESLSNRNFESEITKGLRGNTSILWITMGAAAAGLMAYWLARK